MKEAPWTPKTLLDWCEGYFLEKGIPSPRYDAELLLSSIISCSRLELYLHFDRPMTPPELAAFRALVKKRAERIPTAYITGEVHFWDQTLAIGPGCLIPRGDTEILVETTIEAIKRSERKTEEPLLVLELGTGSGAIPLAVLSETENIHWVGVECAPQALAYAQTNRAHYQESITQKGNKFHLVQGDKFQALAVNKNRTPHFLVSNPPYIPTQDISSLEPEVRDAEPVPALDGGATGLDFYRYLLQWGGENLSPGGEILVEMGYDQGPALETLSKGFPQLSPAGILSDLAGNPRVFQWKKN